MFFSGKVENVAQDGKFTSEVFNFPLGYNTGTIYVKVGKRQGMFMFSSQMKPQGDLTGPIICLDNDEPVMTPSDVPWWNSWSSLQLWFYHLHHTLLKNLQNPWPYEWINLKVSAKFTRNKFKNITASYLLTSYIISICQNDQNVEPSIQINTA